MSGLSYVHKSAPALVNDRRRERALALLTARESGNTLSQMDWQNLETFSFGDSPDLANRLVELVLSGSKRATCWAESQGLLSAEVGKMMVDRKSVV